MLKRINRLIDDICRSPFDRGIGKTEKLRENLAGFSAKKIDHEHRLVYRVVGSGDDQHLEIIHCREHY